MAKDSEMTGASGRDGMAAKAAGAGADAHPAPSDAGTPAAERRTGSLMRPIMAMVVAAILIAVCGSIVSGALTARATACRCGSKTCGVC